MISIQKGLEDYKKLETIVKGVNENDIDIFVELISGNTKCNITNDLRKENRLIDLNYQSICATICQGDKGLYLTNDIECWDEDGSLNFVSVNIYNYQKYNTTVREDGRVQITSSHPYDEQEYYYAIGSNVYRSGKFIEKVAENTSHNIDRIDEIILRLMQLNMSLKPKMCHY